MGIRELTVEELSEVAGGKSIFGSIATYVGTQLATYAAGLAGSAAMDNIRSGNTPDYSRTDSLGNSY